MPKPTVAILGKPNVGKSTLFNRLIGGVHSIVSPIEGVTRDRIYGQFDWQGKEFNLIDTGGYIPDSLDIIESHVRLQAEIAVEEADLIVFMVDGRAKLTTSDYYLARQIQKTNKSYLLLVNKIDELKHEELTTEFYELGLGDFFTLSAQNSRRIGDVLDAIVQKFNNWDFSNKGKQEHINLAIVGMPNVGKSSLMNTIIKEEKSIVTPLAGTTRDSIDSYIRYYKQNIRLIDTAGLRNKTKITDKIEYYSSIRTYRVINDCDVAAVLIDAKKGFNNQDKDIVRYIIDSGKGLLVVVNKWDLLEKNTHTQKNYHQDIIEQFPMLSYYPILFISIVYNLRINQVLKYCLKIFYERKKEIKTVELNSFIKRAISYHPPPLVKGKNITIKYATQVHHSPPVFALFSNQPRSISIQYKRYLENSLRDYFGFGGVPIKLSFRQNK